jgi:hypothetical protein
MPERCDVLATTVSDTHTHIFTKACCSILERFSRVTSVVKGVAEDSVMVCSHKKVKVSRYKPDVALGFPGG